MEGVSSSLTDRAVEEGDATLKENFAGGAEILDIEEVNISCIGMRLTGSVASSG